MQNVQNSTPKGFLRKNKATGLAFEVSPIRLDETMDSDDGFLNKEMMDSIRRQRLKEIEAAKELESSAMQGAKALLEGINKTKKQIEEKENSNTQLEKIETPKAQPRESNKRKSLPKPKASGFDRTLIEEASTSICDTATASPVIKELAKQIAKKSIRISHQPAIGIVPRRSSRGSLINRGKKSIRFAEVPEADRIVLQPGKSWRRSLVNHRKSLHGNGVSNRRTTVIIEEDEEPSPVVKRYTEKLLETLGECKFF